MTPAQLIVEMAGQIVAAKRDLVTADEVQAAASHAAELDDAARFLWGLRCRAALVRLGSAERFALEDALECCRQMVRQQRETQ